MAECSDTTITRRRKPSGRPSFSENNTSGEGLPISWQVVSGFDSSRSESERSRSWRVTEFQPDSAPVIIRLTFKVIGRISAHYEVGRPLRTIRSTSDPREGSLNQESRTNRGESGVATMVSMMNVFRKTPGGIFPPPSPPCLATYPLLMSPILNDVTLRRSSW